MVGAAATLTGVGAQAVECGDTVDVTPGRACATVDAPTAPGGSHGISAAVTPDEVAADSFREEPRDGDTEESTNTLVRASRQYVVLDADHAKTNQPADDIQHQGLWVVAVPPGGYFSPGAGVAVTNWPERYYAYAFEEGVFVGREHDNYHTGLYEHEQVYVRRDPDGRITTGRRFNGMRLCSGESVSTNPIGGDPVPTVTMGMMSCW